MHKFVCVDGPCRGAVHECSAAFAREGHEFVVRSGYDMAETNTTTHAVPFRCERFYWYRLVSASPNMLEAVYAEKLTRLKRGFLI
jgi:hypothetical protein